jgi:hypothetical protein
LTNADFPVAIFPIANALPVKTSAFSSVRAGKAALKRIIANETAVIHLLFILTPGLAQ